MIDVDRLKEALTYEEDLRNDLGIAWKDAPNTESCFALFDRPRWKALEEYVEEPVLVGGSRPADDEVAG